MLCQVPLEQAGILRDNNKEFYFFEFKQLSIVIFKSLESFSTIGDTSSGMETIIKNVWKKTIFQPFHSPCQELM